MDIANEDSVYWKLGAYDRNGNNNSVFRGAEHDIYRVARNSHTEPSIPAIQYIHISFR